MTLKERLEESKIPKMSKKSAETYSNIHQCIPYSKENLTSITPLDVSVTEIQVSLDKIAELKKNETLNKVVSLTVLAVSITLIAVIILLAIFFPFAGPGALGASLALGLAGPIDPIIFALCSSLWVYFAFNFVSNAEKELSTKSLEIETNHEKFKTYFTVNYSDLKEKIEESIGTRIKFLGELLGKKGADVAWFR
ncbi:MAG: hypothetical protein H0T62_08320 [Parachlamydiaceae bacterium]|nr:hypothetical protein [Parachlamydiaceae bacterium]